jgi:hypothetical protein
MELLPIPLIAILLVSWGTVVVCRGKTRLTHRSELHGIAARLTGAFIVMCGVAILAIVYWVYLGVLAIPNR